MQEIWKDIVGYEGYYQVSDRGNVRSVTRLVHHSKGGKRVSNTRIIKQAQNGDGYYFVGLHKDNNTKYLRVNRLVAEAFIPNPENLPCVNHRDKNRLNNRASNLEWCTVEYNNRYSIARRIIQCTLNGGFVREWESGADVARELHINASNIAQCCRGTRTTAGGYIWHYKEAR